MKTVKTVHELRTMGYKIRIQHLRTLRVIGDPTHLVEEREFRKVGKGCDLNGQGGYTTVELTPPNGQPMQRGTSACSFKDNFNRKLGVRIALNRAFDKFTGGFEGIEASRQHEMAQ